MMITGRCFCGNIKYEFEDLILNSGICHCYDCQRLTGGVAWPFIVVLDQSLSIQGTVKEFTRTGASGKKVHMGFCETCGSTVFGRPEFWPHIRTISASSLDDPQYFSPSVYVWTQDAPQWFLFDPDIPKFERNPN